MAAMNQQGRVAEPPVRSPIGQMYVRALIIDGDIAQQQLARDYLVRLGCQVDVAGDVQLAVALTQIVRYHLIFIEASALAGLSDTSPLRDLEVEGRCISIISMLDRSDPATRSRHIAMGANDLVSRPLTAQNIQAAVETWLRRGSADLAHRV
jgi:DNA-binding response OmpR family regulator